MSSYKYDDGSYYKQRDGHDRYRNVDENGHTTDRGHAQYGEDGSLTRLDHINTYDDGTHGHTWLKERPDGTWEYGYGRHDDH